MYTKWLNKGKHLVILVSHIHYNSCLITRGRPFHKGMLQVIDSVVIKVVTSIMRCTSKKLCLGVKIQHLQWRLIL